VKAVASEIKAMGRRSLSITVDVRYGASLEDLLRAVLEAFGNVHTLFNSAGRIKRLLTIESTESDWREILDTNLIGILRACQVFGREHAGNGVRANY
jgi:NAD(P)-dependent dehydrogenase (short-subunit alcohol dehydrogenase family)